MRNRKIILQDITFEFNINIILFKYEFRKYVCWNLLFEMVYQVFRRFDKMSFNCMSKQIVAC